jgi:hypothetical protein
MVLPFNDGEIKVHVFDSNTLKGHFKISYLMNVPRELLTLSGDRPGTTATRAVLPWLGGAAGAAVFTGSRSPGGGL